MRQSGLQSQSICADQPLYIQKAQQSLYLECEYAQLISHELTYVMFDVWVQFGSDFLQSYQVSRLLFFKGFCQFQSVGSTHVFFFFFLLRTAPHSVLHSCLNASQDSCKDCEDVSEQLCHGPCTQPLLPLSQCCCCVCLFAYGCISRLICTRIN